MPIQPRPPTFRLNSGLKHPTLGGADIAASIAFGAHEVADFRAQVLQVCGRGEAVPVRFRDHLAKVAGLVDGCKRVSLSA
jgi:hypothetical protein